MKLSEFKIMEFTQGELQDVFDPAPLINQKVGGQSLSDAFNWIKETAGKEGLAVEQKEDRIMFIRGGGTKRATMNTEEGNLNMGRIRSGVFYEGRFYEFGTIEYKNLMLIEGKKEDNRDTLLGLFSQIVTQDPNNITEQN